MENNIDNVAHLPEGRGVRRPLRRAAVLGAGVMGAQIAAHLANASIPVTLFELPGGGDDRSAPARGAIKSLAKLKPAPLGTAGVEARILPANYEDDLEQLAECDLIIEAIAERLDIKASLYASLAPHVSKHAVLASNTSGLSINALADVLPESIRSRFLGVHFFNPPRYMHLVELIPSRHTDAGIIDWLEPLLVSTLGKGVVIARDTPNFIGNRIGVFSLVATMHHAVDLGIGFEVVDQITGKPLGRPKSGTFRTADVVGLDTLGHVINTLRDNLDNDPWHRYYQTPDYIEQLVAAGALGQKTRKGLY
ncbi:MAG: 3-hydroxyacyl-CoA dehydrogenase family protein, partial [Gammaproteobacteria bacterium]|nr:3-hydroxyacyl-CoA dehydrogenase family protein [Gammaproteobacteria bacterium]